MKNTKIILSILLVGIILFTVESCKKYEEGPSISIYSKEKRLTQKCDEELIIINNDTILAEDITIKESFTINKDNAIIIEIGDEYSSDVINGTWEFFDNKEFFTYEYSFISYYPIDTVLHTFVTKTENEILKLTKDELWVIENLSLYVDNSQYAVYTTEKVKHYKSSN